ncbi:MAG: alpha/beta hydrolase-fold protein [Bacteroidota bacterium]|nr:alpha/beta hydrolase-fold protein [Bacteroidota bacterium]
MIAIAIGVQIIKHNRSIWGKTYSIHSKILNKSRTIRVYLPAGYKKSVPNNQLYPVVYLFDGDALYSPVLDALKQLRNRSDAAYPEMIVVAIKHTDRARDFTPTSSLIGPEGNKLDMLKSSGGSENFIDFVQKELIPHIESVYPASPQKILIGYSLGGLTVMIIFIHQNKMFDAYAAIDPSMWWDGNKALSEAMMKVNNIDFTSSSLFIAVANTMPAGMDIKQVKNDATASTNHIRSILGLIGILKRNCGNGFNWEHKYYPDTDHDSVVSPGVYDALKFLFDKTRET